MTSIAERITEGLRWLAGEFSASRDEFRSAMRPDGAALLEGCHSLGYIARGTTRDTRDRVVVTTVGQRRLADVEGRERVAEA